MQKYLLLAITLFTLTSTFAIAESGGSVSLEDSRLKIQFSVPSDQSGGAFQLRSILEKHGFKNEEGFVKTNDALAPLEIYNYLYDSGRYVFTIYLPVNDTKFFVSFDQKGFVSFGGIAAQRLFDVVKRYVERNDINNLEQYKWAKHSYCDRTKSGAIEYRCWIER